MQTAWGAIDIEREKIAAEMRDMKKESNVVDELLSTIQDSITEGNNFLLSLTSSDTIISDINITYITGTIAGLMHARNVIKKHQEANK